jgi:hypothetical protein
LSSLLNGRGESAELTKLIRQQYPYPVVEGIALLAFVPGGIPRMPQLCEAHDAQAIACALAVFKEAEQSKEGKNEKESAGQEG